MEPPVKKKIAWTDGHFRFAWVVEASSFIKGQKGTLIKSPEFQIGIAGDCLKCWIELWPFGTANNVNDESSINLAVDTNCNNLVMHCEFSLLILDKCMTFKVMGSAKSMKAIPMKQGTSRGFFCLVKRSDYYDALRNVSDGNHLRLIANIKVSNYIQNIYGSSTDLRSSIIDDLAKLRRDADYSDILITVRGSGFQAHKNILAARSSVFSSMFKHNMKEANTGRIEVEDMTPEVFGEFLKFIYTGDANIYDYASELFTAGDKYDVQDLKVFCRDILIKSINKENCIKTLVLSDLHSSTLLKEAAMNFIVSNTHNTDTNKLAEIKNPSLMLELLNAFMNHKKI